MQSNSTDSLWTPERKTKLVDLWAAGLSASKISNELDGLFSRNAVLGKAFRMGLAKRKTVTSADRNRSKPKRQKVRWQPRLCNEVIDEKLPPPDFLGITFSQTDKNSCMYPEGEGASMMFCGQPRKEGSSFCPGHHRICYHRPDKTKRSSFMEAA